MPITYSATVADAAEMDGYPTEDWGPGGLRATTQLRCDWEDRYDLLDEILSFNLLYPHLPGALARAVSGSIVPMPNSRMSQDGQGAGYDNGLALVTINFERVEEDENGELYSEDIEPNAEFSTLDHTLFVWPPPGGGGFGEYQGGEGGFGGEGSSEYGSDEYSDGLPLKPAEAPGRLLVSLDYSQTQYKMESVPFAYLSLIGHVNHQPVTAPLIGLTFPAETLLFHPPKLRRSINMSGEGLWTAQKRFSYRPSGWNRFWHARLQAYSRMYLRGETDPYYNFPLGDLSQVISGVS